MRWEDGQTPNKQTPRDRGRERVNPRALYKCDPQMWLRRGLLLTSLCSHSTLKSFAAAAQGCEPQKGDPVPT